MYIRLPDLVVWKVKHVSWQDSAENDALSEEPWQSLAEKQLEQSFSCHRWHWSVVLDQKDWKTILRHEKCLGRWCWAGIKIE